MEKNVLNWRFDVNTFRLIGRDLITDRITAVFELVKNSYDANAENVRVELYNVSKGMLNSKIVIKDDGIGMSFEDIRDKWMVIGTASKRNQTQSPAPYNRKYVGEKGIGRFAVDKLGGRVRIRTKKQGEQDWLNVDINWESYESLAKNQELTLFTEVGNTYFYEKADNIEEHGTSLIITAIREEWTLDNIKRLSKELTKIVSPFQKINPPFEIFLYSNEFEKTENLDGQTALKANTVDYASHQAEITFFIDNENPQNSYQEVLKFDKEKGVIYTEKTPIEIFGGVKLKLYFFNQDAKIKFNKHYKNDDTRIDGIKIYRDGIVTTPFAEMASEVDYQRDILGIHKRVWRDIFDRISTREVIGFLDITKEDNPDIIDATNRQDFIDNRGAYTKLKEFIIQQLDVFSEVKKFQREEKKQIIDETLQKAQQESKIFEQTIKEIEKKLERVQPELKKDLEPLKKQSEEIKAAIKKGIEQQQKERKEFLRKENIYLSLMSLQEFAAQLAHAVRQSLGGMKDMVEFFKNKFPNPKYDDIFKKYSQLTYEELNKLKKIVDFMLSYASSSEESIEEFKIKDTIEYLINQVYDLTFEKEKISIFIELENCVLFGNKRFFEDIIQQFISNSIKFLKQNTTRKIRCTGYIQDNHYILLFSDNGIGIPKENRERVFDIYFTTSAEDGGAGIGLWIAKLRVEAFKGTIQVIDSELENGATFKIILPFKNF